jgi:hypothetical protein
MTMSARRLIDDIEALRARPERDSGEMALKTVALLRLRVEQLGEELKAFKAGRAAEVARIAQLHARIARLERTR